MTFFDIIFYITASVVVSSTALAITRKNAVHAVCFIVISFMGTAILFYLLGAPLLAALEVIIYAGGIMVLFVFVIMMTKMEKPPVVKSSLSSQWIPAVILGSTCIIMAGILVFSDSGKWLSPPAVTGTPKDFGIVLFQDYWLAVEIASFLLLMAMIGALYLGRRKAYDPPEEKIQEKNVI